MKLFDRLAADAFDDKYFQKLLDKINELYFQNLFNKSHFSLDKKESIDLLRFSDILSNSSDVKYRSLSYKIITLLYPFYPEDAYFKSVSTAVLSKMGNFPALQLMDYDVKLPIDREIEKDVKKSIQHISEFDNIFLTDSQFSLYQKMKASHVFSFSGPTSMGKSFMMKIVISEQMKKNIKPNITVIVPTRALIHQFASEIKRDLHKQLEENNYTVITNGNLEGINIEGTHLIMVLTPERLLSYLSEENYPMIHSLFVDEAHKLASETDKRSVTLYTAVERAIFSNRNIQLFFASPNVSNPEVFLQLFNKGIENVYYSNESPVSQQLFFVDLINKRVTHYTDNGTKEYKPSVVNKHQNSLKIIDFLSQDQSNLIYCNSPRQTVSKAREFSKNFGEKEISAQNKKRIQEATKVIKKIVHPDYYLIDCLQKGVAYHFGNLPQVVRYNVEQLFKDGVIKHLFCTSTLLEGVNLPAKNVFILNNKNGIRKFRKVDFWNLAGRAGRLKYELSGNIYCIREEEKDWKKIDDLVTNKEKIHLNPTVANNLEKNIKQIELAILNQEIYKGNETEKDILRYLANIISIDTIDLNSGYQSPIIEKLYSSNQGDLIELAQKKVRNIEIPHHILKTNQFMAVEQQETAYQYVVKNKDYIHKTLYPKQINYESCLATLNLFYDIYQWDKYESRLKNKRSLLYFALLMNNWINGRSLNELINQSIDYYAKNRRNINYYDENNKKQLEVFNRKSRLQVNTLINDLIKEIEGILRFTIQKYVNHYYLILQEVYGKEKAGTNWTNYLEYGTRNSVVITLQNMGLSRYVANLLLTDFSSHFKIQDGDLIKIFKNELIQELEEGSIEMQEVLMFL
ncbi:DEAD/DEAH box helicase [Metabacillus hrfriensis]|uniref:DEAD/DEAH box helicase n=1 Tax=Metabacillus hrfriensis TaxID=3048891 RepID=A0ACD4RHW2_9BACI|nr:DEAD/DEAH box helicase [Metabacillus sp. CT-WN-B3]WHZ60090.1 DEAD/DEAH box helicase [Metabacillus sp. CT-WN-B3]